MYWADYLRKTHVLVYVVDSSDRHRLPQAKSELHRLLKANAKLPVVVLGNKQVRRRRRKDGHIHPHSHTHSLPPLIMWA